MNRGVAASAAVSLLLLVGGCGGGGSEAAPERAPGADSLAMAPSDDSATAAATVPADPAAAGVDAGLADDPFRGFEVPGENGTGEMRHYRLRLRNDGTALAIVSADGGAGEVLVDTVPAGSWRPVEIDSRARVVRLRSVSPSGEVLRETELGLPGDTAIDVDIGGGARTE
jgi:hypothetical protein